MQHSVVRSQGHDAQIPRPVRPSLSRACGLALNPIHARPTLEALRRDAGLSQSASLASSQRHKAVSEIQPFYVVTCTMAGMPDYAECIKIKFDTLQPLLVERTRRIWAAVQAKALGRGGISRVAESTGMSPTTMRSGLRELETGAVVVAPGGGTGGREGIAPERPRGPPRRALPSTARAARAGRRNRRAAPPRRAHFLRAALLTGPARQGPLSTRSLRSSSR